MGGIHRWPEGKSHHHCTPWGTDFQAARPSGSPPCNTPYTHTGGAGGPLCTGRGGFFGLGRARICWLGNLGGGLPPCPTVLGKFHHGCARLSPQMKTGLLARLSAASGICSSSDWWLRQQQEGEPCWGLPWCSHRLGGTIFAMPWAMPTHATSLMGCVCVFGNYIFPLPLTCASLFCCMTPIS